MDEKPREGDVIVGFRPASPTSPALRAARTTLDGESAGCSRTLSALLPKVERAHNKVQVEKLHGRGVHDRVVLAPAQRSIRVRDDGALFLALSLARCAAAGKRQGVIYSATEDRIIVY